MMSTLVEGEVGVHLRRRQQLKRGNGENHFVIHEHHARTDHFDFRLERDGVLKSWTVPKGPPPAVGEKRLAIEVEDHPLAWADFEGVIPAGQYGAGSVHIWDHGTYTLHEWSPDKIVFELHGSRINGSFALVRYPRSGNTHWLLVRCGHADPT